MHATAPAATMPGWSNAWLFMRDNPRSASADTPHMVRMGTPAATQGQVWSSVSSPSHDVSSRGSPPHRGCKQRGRQQSRHEHHPPHTRRLRCTPSSRSPSPWTPPSTSRARHRGPILATNRCDGQDRQGQFKTAIGRGTFVPTHPPRQSVGRCGAKQLDGQHEARSAEEFGRGCGHASKVDAKLR